MENPKKNISKNGDRASVGGGGLPAYFTCFPAAADLIQMNGWLPVVMKGRLLFESGVLEQNDM